MQIFEIYFNPKKKRETIFDSFYYKPKDIYESKLGSLFMAGELENSFSSDEHLLKNLSRTIKTKFYSPRVLSPENSLKKSLKEANAFLEGMIKEGNVDWLSNLNFTILNLVLETSSTDRETRVKRYKLNLAKVGKVGIFLIRGKEILDMGGKLELEEIEPYPLKVFSNIISGWLEPADKILITTQDVHGSPLFKDWLQKLVPLGAIEQGELSKSCRELGRYLSGVCLLIDLSVAKDKESKKIILKEKKSSIFLKMFSSISVLFTNISKRINQMKPASPPASSKTRFAKDGESRRAAGRNRKTASKSGLTLPAKLFDILSHLKKQDLFKKALLILLLLAVLFLGRFITRLETDQRIKEIENDFNKIQEEVRQANSLLLLGEEAQANDSLQKALKKINILSKIPSPIVEEIIVLKEEIGIKLLVLNKVEIIENPQPLFEFKEEEFLPQKIITVGDKIYCFSSYSQNMFELGLNGEIKSYQSEKDLNNAVLFDDNLLFFSKPNWFIFFETKEGLWDVPFSLDSPSAEFQFKSPVSFDSNLYFWDEAEGQIVRYKYLIGLGWQAPELWLSKKIPSNFKPISITVDGGLYLLKEDGSIDYYSDGRFKKRISPQAFPPINNPTKIWASFNVPYLYILEPEQNRILVIDKNDGRIIKQYQSKAFNNLKDFTVSEQGETIYLLNGSGIYRLLTK